MDFSTQLLAASIFSPANSSAAITAPLTPSAASYAFSSTTATASRNWDMPRPLFARQHGGSTLPRSAKFPR